jgi:hypothetical protein
MMVSQRNEIVQKVELTFYLNQSYKEGFIIKRSQSAVTTCKYICGKIFSTFSNNTPEKVNNKISKCL